MAAGGAGEEERRWPRGLSNEIKFRVLHFTPSWFSVTMGTGISAVLLNQLPYQFTGLREISIAVFLLNVALFTVFFVASVARYIAYPSVWRLMIHHPVQSMFLGTIPMGFATLVIMACHVCLPQYGDGMLYFVWTLWWIDSVVAVAIALGLPFMMFTRQIHETANMTAVWLLPIVGPNVSASAGAVVAEYLPAHHAVMTIHLSYLMLGLSIFPALMIMALYFNRLALHKLPPRAQIMSAMLPIGPCGQGAFALVQLGLDVRRLASSDQVSFLPGLTGVSLDVASEAIFAVSVVVALLIWGLGCFWALLAIATFADLARSGSLPFNMGWWALTFPSATMATSAILFANVFDAEGWRIVATIISAIVLLFWLFIATRTVIDGIRGTIFVAPCLGDAPMAAAKGIKPEAGARANG